MMGLTITVPASTANIGPGFDSAGMALGRYLTLSITPSEEWEFEHQSVHLPPAPKADEHLIYQTALEIADAFQITMPPAKVMVESEIPLARGLGSSASAVVAGIELANQLCQLSLSDDEKLRWASKIEGHPDNAAASLYGGLVFSAQLSDEHIEIVRHIDQQLEVVVYIPEFELKTADARKVLPEMYSRNQAATASAISNVMIAALLTRDYEIAGKMMEKDLFHEPYRAELITNYEEIRHAARCSGAYGTVISGAGPTMLSLVPTGEGKSISSTIQQMLPNYKIEVLSIDENGVQVRKTTHANNSAK